MTRSSQPVREHILDFDDDFKRTLRRRRNQQESNPPSPEPEFEEQVVEEEEDPMAQVVEEVQDTAADNRISKSFLPQVWTMQCLYASNTPRQPKGRQKSWN
ncbi:hypothetical protein ACFX2G_044762 [Malus domestica]